MRYALLLFLVLLGGSLASAPAAASTISPHELGIAATGGFGDSIPVDSVGYVRRVGTIPERPVDGDQVHLVLDGVFPYKCGVIESSIEHPFTFRLRPWPPICSSTMPGPWRWTIDLGTLRAGFYRVMYELQVVSDPAGLPGDSVTFYHGVFEFAVARSDSQPPPPALLPYVDHILIQRKPDMLPFERICATDSIQVTVEGTFPSDCYSLTSIEIDYNRGAPPLHVVHVTVDDHGCQDRLCQPGRYPWRGHVILPPYAEGPHVLPVILEVETCGSPRQDSTFATRVPFVVDTCRTPPPPFGCLIQGWIGRGGVGQCNAFISPLQPAEMAFRIGTPVALSGLQGQIGLSAYPGPQALRITRIEPIGPAAGMHLSWVATPEGARFVLFAQRGAPIVPGLEPASILKVTFEVIPGQAPPAQTYVSAFDLLGSDAQGNAVQECNFMNVRLAPAVICSGRDCDDNGDGRVDVRDLVLMVRCVRPDSTCPERVHFDCNQDGIFSLDDVICCARRILGRPSCPNCPPDSTTPRKEPQVRLAFGTPRPEGTTLTLPMRLEGGSRLGAARFAIKYPAERYDVASVEFPGAPSDWLTLYEIQDDQVVVGLIQIAPGNGNVPVDLVVRLTLESGQSAGGEVRYEDAEFSGPDGVPLEITMDRGALRLTGPARIALSENRPNPFGRSTTFSITLDRAAAVEISVFDVGGRSVASIQNGPLAPGTHPFTWDGRAADGSVAQSGIYFIRAVTGDQSVSRRMVLLRTP